MYLLLISLAAQQFFNRTAFLETVQGQKMIKCGIQRDVWGSVCLTEELGINSERSSSWSKLPQVLVCKEAPQLNNQV